MYIGQYIRFRHLQRANTPIREGHITSITPVTIVRDNTIIDHTGQVSKKHPFPIELKSVGKKNVGEKIRFRAKNLVEAPMTIIMGLSGPREAVGTVYNHDVRLKVESEDGEIYNIFQSWLDVQSFSAQSRTNTDIRNQ